MAATALLKFSQGLNVGADGQALKGVTGSVVDVANSDNTGVVSWQIDLVYVDPSSSIPPATPFAFNDNSNTPFATFTPDVRGSYRFVLSVWGVPNRFGTPTSRDIRVFAVPEPHSLVVPPAQLWPLPLPVPQSGLPGNRPNELNFNNQPDGWAGDGLNDGLLNELIRRVDSTVSSAKQETITVLSNGQTSFTLSTATTSDSTVEMYVNGVKQSYGTDYTASGAAITYGGIVALQTTDIVEFWYIIGALGGGGGGGSSVALTNTFWVDTASTLPGGIPFSDGTQGAFSTITAAIAAATPGTNLRLFIVDGSYAGEGALSFATFPNVSVYGVGEAPVLPPLTAANLKVKNVSCSATVSCSGAIKAESSTFTGALTTTTLSTLSDCHTQAALTIGDGSALRGCIIDNTPLITGQNISVDQATLTYLGNFGATSGTTEPSLVLDGLSGSGSLTAWLRNENRTLNSPSVWSTSYAVLLGGTLTGARTITVDMTQAAAKGLFIIDVFGNQGGNTCTVNGTQVVPSANQGLRSIFQNVSGTLTLIQSIIT